MVNQWLNNIHNYLFPDHCLVCLSPEPGSLPHLCPDCSADLPIISHACWQCGIALPDATAHVCGECLKHKPYYDTALIPFYYQPPLPRLISQFKFSSNLSLLPLLSAAWLSTVSLSERTLPECLVPVPLHPSRLRERGFNQSLELARTISQSLGIRLEPHLCRRTVATESQSGLDAEQRRRNIKNAFAVNGRPAYRHVAIVDDVVTTGSTLNELARMLKKSGIERVEIWAIARAVK